MIDPKMLFSSHKKLRFRLDGFLVLAILMLVYSPSQTSAHYALHDDISTIVASFFGPLQPASVTSHICRCSIDE